VLDGYGAIQSSPCSAFQASNTPLPPEGVLRISTWTTSKVVQDFVRTLSGSILDGVQQSLFTAEFGLEVQAASYRRVPLTLRNLQPHPLMSRGGTDTLPPYSP
jgi:hypothetical protein